MDGDTDGSAWKAIAAAVLLAAAVVGLVSWFGNSSAWDVFATPPPWGDRPSIFGHVDAHVGPDGKLRSEGKRLPDEAEVREAGGIRFAPGAMDGVSTHHMGLGDPGSLARSIERKLRKLLRRSDARAARAFYDAVRKEPVLAYVDPLLEALVDSGDTDADRVHDVGEWLVRAAPDREAVKLGIALLGLVRNEGDTELLRTIARHDEFTLYVAVAMTRRPDADRLLWDLGRSVDGWGRVYVVERLAETDDAEIQAWLLRTGYRNRVMYEYTALICATTGGLADALAAPAPDPEVLRAAADLLHALCDGRRAPAEGVEEYADGPRAIARYVELVEDGDVPLLHYDTLRSIRAFVGDENEAWDELRAFGWTDELRRELVERCDAAMALPSWSAQVRRDIQSADPETFRIAAFAAKPLGVDVWEQHFQRLEGPDALGAWLGVCETDDPARMDRVVERAHELLPIEDIAAGSRDPEYHETLGSVAHQHLDFVVSALARFPGKGWELVRASLESSAARNRVVAATTLAEWGKPNWPDDAEAALTTAARAERDDRVRETLAAVLRGENPAEQRLAIDD